MRVCIVGAGSIGSFVGARLARAGADVTLVARGDNLRALQAHGLQLVAADGTRSTHELRAVRSLAEAGAHDVVVLATKAHQLGDLVDALPAACHADTVLVPMQNGIPWWYFQGFPGAQRGRAIQAVDAGGTIAARIPAGRILGCVVYPACEMLAPGIVRHVEGERFPLGELDGTLSPRAERISALFAAGGLKAPVLADIRSEIWLKLWGNLCFNPISALTRATLAGICRDDHARALAAGMMEEARAVAIHLGATFRVSAERRIEGAARVGEHRTSMLQDIESRRRTELDALLGAVIELAGVVGVSVPRLEAVYACTRLLEQIQTGAASRPAMEQAAAA
ncbi:MAG: ketopantoate reductase family protein [Betaproteobacteria bacterium]